MAMGSTQDNVERWLVHEGLRFKHHKKTDADTFRIVISGPPDARDVDTEIFEPARQRGVIVIGRRCPFGISQNVRFLDMTASEQDVIRERITSYCNSIGAVHRFLVENGLNMVGIYIVIDKEERQNQEDFSEALRDVMRMADQIKVHLRRTV